MGNRILGGGATRLTDSVSGAGRRTAKIALVLAAMFALFSAFSLDATRATGSFTPTIDFETSTTRATSHPDARITIDNSSSTENIRNVTVSLPNGFWGSLAAADQCDFDDADDGLCAAGSRIGTVASQAEVVEGANTSSVLLRGSVYLTEAAPANAATDPAGVSVKVNAVVGSVDLGDVIVHGRVVPRYASAPVGFTGNILGIDTIFNDIPQSITDTNARTVNFNLKKMVVDLVSDPTSPNPLLTNPSSCSTVQVTASMQSWSATPEVPTPVNYTPTGCSSLKFSASTFSFGFTDPTAGTNTGLTSTISFPEDNPTFSRLTLGMPPTVSLNLPAFGITADQCPVTSYTGNPPVFNPATCPSQAKIGTASITSPLLPDPLTGSIWLLAKSPTPWIALDVSDTTPGNPKGINIRSVGQASVVQLDPLCDSLSYTCDSRLQVVFNGVPQAPVSSIQITMNETGRVSSDTGNPALSGKVLAVAGANDPVCQAENDFTGSFISHTTGTAAEIATISLTGCNHEIFDSAGAPLGGRTTNTSPTLPFTTSQTGLYCSIDVQPSEDPCDEPSYAASGLSTGIHRLNIDDLTARHTRAFIVDPASTTPDTTNPSTTLDDAPGATTADTTPTFDFSSDESSMFQCALAPGSSVADVGAFLPCGGSSAASSGSFTVPNADALLAGHQYTFAVRAQDGAGNVDLTPASATFTIDIPFAPTFTADVSTPVARAHPDLDIEILNPSNEDIEDLEFNLPDGFFGGLTGVASLCSIASADAGACTASSKVGTVETEAAVDESTIRITGDVFLTEPRNPSTEPASLSIKIEPAIQDVVFNDIIVNASLKIRGVAQGIDTFALDLPNSASSTLDGTTEFDLRRMKISLRTGTGAPYPLLTNPSACGTATFNAKFGGYDDSATTESDSFDVIGCDALGFAPQLGISMVDGKTGKAPGPGSATNAPEINLTANLTADPNGAGIKRVSLLMPKPVTINVLKIPFACAQAQADLKACPPSAAIGTVSATSPLLNEPLQGTVYLLQQLPGEAIPRLLLALRGRINVDIIANNSFENQTQIRTVFDVLPDVPLSSFAMTINGFLTTRNEACEYSPSIWNAVGDMTGFNNKTAPINIPLDFSCNKEPVFTSKFVNRGKKSTLSMTAKPGAGKKLKKLTLTLPRGVKFTKAGFSKKKVKKLVIVRADGRRLAAKCFKLRRANRLEINLCGRQALTVTLSLKAGTLTATKRVKKPKLKLQVLQSDNLAANALAVK